MEEAPAEYRAPLVTAIVSRCKDAVFKELAEAAGPTGILAYWRRGVTLEAPPEPQTRDRQRIVAAARAVFADTRRKDTYSEIATACCDAIDILGDLPDGAPLLAELERTIDSDEKGLEEWFASVRQRDEAPPSEDTEKPDGSTEEHLADENRAIARPLARFRTLGAAQQYCADLGIRFDDFDTETDVFPNHHDRRLRDLAALVEELAALEPWFEEIPPTQDDGDDDDELLRDDERLAGYYRLRAYLQCVTYEVISEERDDWLDVPAMLGLLNRVCVDLGLAHRFISIERDYSQCAHVAAGRVDALEQAIADGALVPANPAAAADRGIAFEDQSSADVDRNERRPAQRVLEPPLWAGFGDALHPRGFAIDVSVSTGRGRRCCQRARST